MERGGDLTKEDLDVGRKKDQDLYEMPLREYNDRSITVYGESAFPRIWTSSKIGLSDNFETISCSADIKTPYHDLLNRYVDVQSGMQLSGTYDDGEEIPIQKYSLMIIMQYFHYQVENNPGVFKKAHGDLPDDANYDSVNNKLASMKRETKRSKRTQRASVLTDCLVQCKSIPKLLW
jgi:hypothetical protein